MIPLCNLLDINGFHLSCGKITFFQHIVDHALQTHFAAILDRENTADPGIMQLVDFIINNNAATTPKNVNMGGAALFEKLHHVFKILHMSALVRTHGNTLHIFLNSTVHDFLHRSVVSKMDNLSSGTLQYSPHDIDTCVVTIKKAGRRHKSYFMLGLVYLRSIGITRLRLVLDVGIAFFVRCCGIVRHKKRSFMLMTL